MGWVSWWNLGKSTKTLDVTDLPGLRERVPGFLPFITPPPLWDFRETQGLYVLAKTLPLLHTVPEFPP